MRERVVALLADMQMFLEKLDFDIARVKWDPIIAGRAGGVGLVGSQECIC
jgi:hypothetical protein